MKYDFSKTFLAFLLLLIGALAGSALVLLFGEIAKHFGFNKTTEIGIFVIIFFAFVATIFGFKK